MNVPKPKRYKAEIYDVNEFLKLLNLAKDTEWELPIVLAGLLWFKKRGMFGTKRGRYQF